MTRCDGTGAVAVDRDTPGVFAGIEPGREATAGTYTEGE